MNKIVFTSFSHIIVNNTKHITSTQHTVLVHQEYQINGLGDCLHDLGEDEKDDGDDDDDYDDDDDPDDEDGDDDGDHVPIHRNHVSPSPIHLYFFHKH